MAADFLIVGQGLAGTVLGWEFERAGLSFEIVDGEDLPAASRVAAGMINPVSGQRFTRTWKYDAWFPLARRLYEYAGDRLQKTLWHDRGVCIRFLDTSMAERFATRAQRGELDPFVMGQTSAEAHVSGAAQVDFAALLDGSAQHWRQAGRWRREKREPRDGLKDYAQVFDCRGRGGALGTTEIPWEYSRGEVLVVPAPAGGVSGLLHAGKYWLAPYGAGNAMIGTTHDPGVSHPACTAGAREQLQEAAGRFLGGTPRVLQHWAGIRVHLPDRKPFLGPHPRHPKLILCNALGGKGALWAPGLAHEWVNHVTAGVPISREISGERFTPALAYAPRASVIQ